MSTPLLCVLCRETLAEEESRCQACQVTAHHACREEFRARACPTIGCAGDWAGPRAAWESAAPLPRSPHAQLLGCVRVLSVVLLFPVSVGLLWVGGAGNEASTARLVDELQAGAPWQGEQVQGRPVYLEGLILEPRLGEALVPSPVSGDGLLYALHERWTEHRKGGGGSWRQVASGGVACVSTWRERPVRVDLAEAGFPLGLTLLEEQGKDRVHGLRPGARITVFVDGVSREDGGVSLRDPWVFPCESWEETVSQAERWHQRTATAQSSLSFAGWLCLLLGLSGLIGSAVAGRRLRGAGNALPARRP